jgi:hypothetical protein
MDTQNIFGNRLVAFHYAYQSRWVRALDPDEEPAPGTHLVTPWRGFAHHGLYLGAGRIIHYNAKIYELRRRPVEETSLLEFAEGRPLFVVSHAEPVHGAAQAIGRARARLGEDRYHLFHNNCEHLVEWCLHGVARSFQAESALDFPRRAGDWWRARLAGWFRKIARVQPVSRASSESASPESCLRTSAPNSAADSGGLKWKPWY